MAKETSRQLEAVRSLLYLQKAARMMELPVTVTGDRMHTMKTARTTEMGLTSCRASISVAIRAVVSSSATAVDGSDVSVASVDIVVLAAITESALILVYTTLLQVKLPSSSQTRPPPYNVMTQCLPDYHVASGRHRRSTARSLALNTRMISRVDVVAPRYK